MLPVGNRPVIDYIVEDCIRAGITEFMFVAGEESDQIRRYGIIATKQHDGKELVEAIQEKPTREEVGV